MSSLACVLYSGRLHGVGRVRGLGLFALVLARIPQRVPVFIIGVDAVLLNDRTYTLPLIPVGRIPESQTGQLWLTVGISHSRWSGRTVSTGFPRGSVPRWYLLFQPLLLLQQELYKMPRERQPTLKEASPRLCRY